MCPSKYNKKIINRFYRKFFLVTFIVNSLNSFFFYLLPPITSNVLELDPWCLSHFNPIQVI